MVDQTDRGMIFTVAQTSISVNDYTKPDVPGVLWREDLKQWYMYIIDLADLLITIGNSPGGNAVIFMHNDIPHLEIYDDYRE